MSEYITLDDLRTEYENEFGHELPSGADWVCSTIDKLNSIQDPFKRKLGLVKTVQFWESMIGGTGIPTPTPYHKEEVEGNLLPLLERSISQTDQEIIDSFKKKHEITESGELENLIPDIDLKTVKEQIRLLHDLGILTYLRDKYPNSFKSNNNKLAQLVSIILRQQHTAVQTPLNAILNNARTGTSYPKETPRTKAIIDVLNAAKSI